MPTERVDFVAVAGLLLIGVSVVALFFVGKDSDGEHSLKLGLFTIKTRSEAGLFLGGGLLLVCLALLGPAVLGAESNGSTTTTSRSPESGTGGEAVTTTSPANPPLATDPSPPTTTIPPMPDGCTAEIVNPFAAILEQPDPLAQEIRRIPKGSYPVLDWRTENFAGKDSRWLLLSVEGDEGWIEHNLIQVDSTSGCDF